MKKSNRGIKRVLCLLLALIMLSGTALLEPIAAVAVTMADNQPSEETQINHILAGHVEPDEMDDELREALLQALFEELDRLEARLFELQEQRELYLKQIALLTER